MYEINDIILVKDKAGNYFKTADDKYKSYTDSQGFSYWKGLWTSIAYDYFFICEIGKEGALKVLNDYLNPQNN